MQPPPLPTPTSQLTDKKGWVGVKVGNGGFPTTRNVESNLDEEDWELGLIWLQSRQSSSSGRKNVMSMRELFCPDPLAGFEKMAGFQIFSCLKIKCFHS